MLECRRMRISWVKVEALVVDPTRPHHDDDDDDDDVREISCIVPKIPR